MKKTMIVFDHDNFLTGIQPRSGGIMVAPGGVPLVRENPGLKECREFTVRGSEMKNAGWSGSDGRGLQLKVES